jgi:hypothetical protein
MENSKIELFVRIIGYEEEKQDGLRIGKIPSFNERLYME